jgi:hypothetical protein
MNRSIINRSLNRNYARLLGWCGLAVLSTSMVLAQDTAAASTQRTDGQIEMDVVHALDAEQTLKNDLITAATIQGEVTLAGTVASDSSKKLAESVVTKVPGVTKVHNNLTVGNPQEAQNAQQQSPQDSTDYGPPSQADTEPGAQPGPDYGQAPPPPQGYPQSGQPTDQGQYPQQGRSPQPGPYPQRQQSPYPPQYSQGRPQYGSPYPQQDNGPQTGPQYRPATGPVTIPDGTLLQLRTMEPVASKRARDGEPVQFTLISDVSYGGVLAIPRGAVFHGVVTESRQPGSGQLSGHPVLALQLTSLDLGGQTYQINSDEFRVQGPNKSGRTVGNAVGAGVVGTIIGCAVGGGTGCAVGAGAGVAAGTAASAASSGPGVWIPAEALVSFHLRTPLTVNPVSQEEAMRMAQGLYPGGPSLYQRGPVYQRGPAPYPYGPRYVYGRPYPYPYPYAYRPYPRVFYRPYFMAGGVYYWR